VGVQGDALGVQGDALGVPRYTVGTQRDTVGTLDTGMHGEARAARSMQQDVQGA